MLFLLLKNGLCMWISAYPFAENNFFGNPPQLWWIWDFVHMYITQIRTRIWSPATHIYIWKWFFWPSKHYCPSRAQWKKTFCLTLNIMILQSVRNECVRFGRHADIEVNCKIFQLKVLQFWTLHLVFKRGWFEAVLAKNTWGSLGVKNCMAVKNLHQFFKLL
jgi:hypothetical protein